MSNRSSPIPGTPPATGIPDESEADADLPLTMAASVVLTGLPRDAKSALSGAGDLGKGLEKGTCINYLIGTV
jgi:ubiquitin-like protein ATG12